MAARCSSNLPECQSGKTSNLVGSVLARMYVQNNVWNTDMYVQCLEVQQANGFGGFLWGGRGLDKVCYGAAGLRLAAFPSWRPKPGAMTWGTGQLVS